MTAETYEGPLVGGPRNGERVVSRSPFYQVAILAPLSIRFDYLATRPSVKVGEYRFNHAEGVFYWNGSL